MSRSRKRRIPVTILTGFLGAGKTTLLNHILQDPNHGMRFAVIENEFGEVGIDEHILKEQSEEQVIEVMNGCICCTVRGDLVVTLNRLYERIQEFDAVIIETTGLADPAPVAQTFFVEDSISSKFDLDGIITVVDAKHFVARLDEKRPEGIENEAEEQVAFADRILLNKTDLVDEKNKEQELKAIEARIKAVNPTASIIRSQYSKVEPRSLINIKAFRLERCVEMDPAFLNTDEEHEHDPTVSSASCKFVGYLNKAKLTDFIGGILRSMGANLYRYKGVLSMAGRKTKYVFQGVGMIFDGAYVPELRWKKDEPRENRFVFIGKNLDKKMLREGFMACQCSEKTRFERGDRVLAYCGDKPTSRSKAGTGGEWVPAKVLYTWDDGNPYSVQLQGEGKNDRREIYVPVDSDAFIRAAPESEVRKSKRHSMSTRSSSSTTNTKKQRA